MYEITLISKTEPEEKIKKLIGEFGKIVNASALGRRKLAYAIKKETAGYYFDYLVEMEGEKIEELNKKLKMEEELIRYLITQKRERVIKIKPAKKAKGSEEIKKETVAITQKPIVEEEIIKKVEKETEKTIKPKDVIDSKTEIKTVKPIKKKVAPIKTTLPKPKLREVEVTEDERLKALEDKLSELLKD